ncbi:339_t:CDS:2 [Funneliformis geosporum]|uniref:339_t:CDS:1 n=1 Tax=Funneliformis geosporum TaxID=1117311 RepID=A0A9W4WIS2_9GLOM|nr:339_t:CDS:2 [Funneliformis geosporum]
MTCKTYKSLILCFVYIVSCLLFRVESFTPVGRYAHSAVLVGNKIYFFGGFNGKTCTNEVFYLDISQKFNAELPPWTDLTLNSGIGFESCWAAAAVINNDNNPNIFLIGGLTSLQDENELGSQQVYVFNPKSDQWAMPIIKGEEPAVRRRNFKAIVVDNENILAFGGLTTGDAATLIKDMMVLNARELTWSYGNVVNAPTTRDTYTATLLLDGKLELVRELL